MLKKITINPFMQNIRGSKQKSKSFFKRIKMEKYEPAAQQSIGYDGFDDERFQKIFQVSSMYNPQKSISKDKPIAKCNKEIINIHNFQQVSSKTLKNKKILEETEEDNSGNAIRFQRSKTYREEHQYDQNKSIIKEEQQKQHLTERLIQDRSKEVSTAISSVRRKKHISFLLVQANKIYNNNTGQINAFNQNSPKITKQLSSNVIWQKTVPISSNNSQNQINPYTKRQYLYSLLDRTSVPSKKKKKSLPYNIMEPCQIKSLLLSSRQEMLAKRRQSIRKASLQGKMFQLCQTSHLQHRKKSVQIIHNDQDDKSELNPWEIDQNAFDFS